MGAAGGIGQPMSLLLKQSTVVTQLALYDIVGTPGVAADLSHIETQSQVGLACCTHAECIITRRMHGSF